MALTLTDAERSELARRVRSRKGRAEDARRARVILLLAAGESYTTIAAAVGCYPDYVSRWKQRFEAERLAGLRAKYRGQRPTVRTPVMFRLPRRSDHWNASTALSAATGCEFAAETAEKGGW
ncbi:MAG TPA: helix-turn-helix domain-containing protein [Vicinamibacterales bacterium]|nr:helix-turn-helix domain-containing protein [Vicinamibacterales bacterium]